MLLFTSEGILNFSKEIVDLIKKNLSLDLIAKNFVGSN